MSQIYVTILLQARWIPDLTAVRKATGTKKYVLREQMPVYTEVGLNLVPQVQVGIEADVMFLVGDHAVNIIRSNRVLAVDFPSVEEAIEFLRNVETESEE